MYNHWCPYKHTYIHIPTPHTTNKPLLYGTIMKLTEPQKQTREEKGRVTTRVEREQEKARGE